MAFITADTVFEMKRTSMTGLNLFLNIVNYQIGLQKYQLAILLLLCHNSGEKSKDLHDLHPQVLHSTHELVPCDGLSFLLINS